jgi:hypothetical protein
MPRQRLDTSAMQLQIRGLAKTYANGVRALDRVSAKKIRAEGAGNESEVPFDGDVDIGVLDPLGKLIDRDSSDNTVAVTR